MTWSKAYQDALRGGAVEHIARVSFTHPSRPGETFFDLDDDAGTFVLDERATSFATLHVAVPVPADQATLDALDPRTGARLRLYAGYRLPGRDEDVQLIADLALRERIVRRPQNTLELRAESDEALLSGAVLLSGTVPTTGVLEALTTIINTLPGGQNIVADIPTQFRPDLLAGLEVQRGDSLWDAAMTIADSADLWLYCDPLGTWHVTYHPVLTGRTAWQLTTGRTGNITASEAGLSTDLGFANAVVVRHTWRVSTGDDFVRVGIAHAGAPYHPGTVGHYGLTVDRSTFVTQAAANEEAKAILRRTLTRGRTLNVTSPAAYWLQPGQTVTVQLPTGPQERHLTERVAFALATGSMTVRTRLPETVQITGE